jgi:hypothetical protein
MTEWPPARPPAHIRSLGDATVAGPGRVHSSRTVSRGQVQTIMLGSLTDEIQERKVAATTIVEEVTDRSTYHVMRFID